jgi:hypothetical protein
LQTFNMILSLAMSVRAVIHMVLQSRSQHGAAKYALHMRPVPRVRVRVRSIIHQTGCAPQNVRELVEHMMEVSKPMMIICLHELASNDFLLIRLIIEILAQYRDNDGCELLESFQRKLADHRDFYWIARTYDLADAAIDRIRRARELAQAYRSRLLPWHTAGSYTVGAGRVETQHPPSAAYDPEVHQGYGAGVVEVTDPPAYAQSPAPGLPTLASPAAAAWQSAAPPVAPSIEEGLPPEPQPATPPVVTLFVELSAASQLTAVLPDFNEYCEGDLGAAPMRESDGGTSACDRPESKQGPSTMPPLHPDLEYRPLGADVPLFSLDMDESEGQYQPGADM